MFYMGHFYEAKVFFPLPFPEVSNLFLDTTQYLMQCPQCITH